MKKVLLFLLHVVLTFSSNAQCNGFAYCNLDSGSTVRQQIYFIGHDTYYPDMPNLVKIDTHNPNNQWQIGKPHKTVFDSAYSYPNAIVTDTTHPCLASDTSIFTMHVPNFGIRMCYLSFYSRLDIDSGDIVVLECSLDMGGHWVNVLTDSTHLFSFPNGKPTWTTSSMGWDYVFIGYSFEFIDTVLFRFTFTSCGDTTARDGWMLDNFSFGSEIEEVKQVGNNQFLSVYPNPAAAELNVNTSGIVNSVVIYNAVGKIVKSQRFNSLRACVDVVDLSPGIYLVRINGTEVRKFVKE